MKAFNKLYLDRSWRLELLLEKKALAKFICFDKWVPKTFFAVINFFKWTLWVKFLRNQFLQKRKLVPLKFLYLVTGYKIGFLFKSIFLTTVHEWKWPVNDNWLQTRKINDWKVYGKNSKMPRSSCGTSDYSAIYCLKNIKSRRQEMFCKKGFLKNFRKFKGKYLCLCLSF